MAEDEAPEPEADAGSDHVLYDVGDHPALSMGEAETVVPDVVRQMRELEEILRDGARKAGQLVDQGSIYYQAEKALFRCVDEIKRFNSWVEDDYSRGH